MKYGAGDKERVPCRGQIFKGMNDGEVLQHMNDPGMNAQHKPGYYHNPGMAKTMHEYGAGTLKSGSGAPVVKRSQAIAIGLNSK